MGRGKGYARGGALALESAGKESPLAEKSVYRALDDVTVRQFCVMLACYKCHVNEPIIVL